ncbi:endonuclease [Flavobacterium cheniae]|uniref:Putative secreted protein (Por secretion system target) n=1 Tax=Flavobacterium cheniae TaxID=295428 RepID=A0A562KJ21_9FLAO|nr:endonuclease [Flavobacterium cheniae]TDR25767.1 putative secreted protein (Por secretion system target) [Flavobacterium cheniae]TWH95376.1 putative secreted protein (Por secretion system target) [Flavobacterium cheniae]
MKKNFTLLAFLLCSVIGLAQIPAGYYSTATGSGYTLKTQLSTIISTGHTDQGYGALWTLFTQSAFRDNYYENNGSLLDMYSENPTGADAYEYTSTSQQCGSYSGEGNCYNREHLIPQSYFDHFDINPMKNDPFHVVPSDGSVNGARNNLPFGVVNSANYISQNGSKRGSNLINVFSSYNGTVFEPLNEFKGDIARCFFYYATRYENLMDDFYTGANAGTCEAKNMFDGSTNKVFSDAFILLLIKWHKEDPVSAKEIAQNNAIYTFQGNRNPFIDNPSYVCNIWITQCNTVDTLSSDSFTFENGISIYPNPAVNNEVTISSETELKSIVLYNINGQIIQEIKNPTRVDNSYKVNNLSSGFYLVQMASENAIAIKKLIVN